MGTSSIGRKPFCSITLIAALVCSLFVFASSKDKENTSEVKFIARTELALIPTLVTDKSGKHVTGLKQEDFTVLENGAEQKVATFQEITSDPHLLSRPSNPEEFSNSAHGGRATGRITLIVLDLINTHFGDQARTRAELLKYLTESVDQREPTALYTFTRSGIKVIHDFTTDPRILVAALHQLNGDAFQMVDSQSEPQDNIGSASSGPSHPPTGKSSSSGGSVNQHAVKAEADRIQGMLKDSELTFRSLEQRFAILYTLQAMEELAQQLAGVPGRKSLIWAGGGFPFHVSDDTMKLAPAGRDTLADLFPMYEHTWQMLNVAQIALYPVDVKGLQVLVMADASVRNANNNNYARRSMRRQFDNQSTMNVFASMTGGRAYENSNDLVTGFRDAVRDSEEYYMLGYYLDQSKTKPGWRKLVVKAKGEHLEVRARSGFFVTNATVDPGSSRNNDIALALQSPVDFTSIALVARWDKVEASKDPGKKHVNFEMQLAVDPTLINEADNNHVAMEFAAQAKAPDGKPVDSPVGKKIETHLAAEKLSAINQDGVGYRGALDLAPGDYTVRFVVRDDLSGRMGSVAAPLKVE
jgi:VWFA-related protein